MQIYLSTLAAVCFSTNAIAQPIVIRLVCTGTEVSSVSDQSKTFETSLVLREIKPKTGTVSVLGREMEALFVDDMVIFSDEQSRTGIRVLTSGRLDRLTGAFQISRLFGDALIDREGKCTVQKNRKF